MDRQRLFLWVGRASVLLPGDQVPQQHPKTHQQDPQDVGQHPLWGERIVGWPGPRESERNSEDRETGTKEIQIAIHNLNIDELLLIEREIDF